MKTKFTDQIWNLPTNNIILPTSTKNLGVSHPPVGSPLPATYLGYIRSHSIFRDRTSVRGNRTLFTFLNLKLLQNLINIFVECHYFIVDMCFERFAVVFCTGKTIPIFITFGVECRLISWMLYMILQTLFAEQNRLCFKPTPTLLVYCMCREC